MKKKAGKNTTRSLSNDDDDDDDNKVPPLSEPTETDSNNYSDDANDVNSC